MPRRILNNAPRPPSKFTAMKTLLAATTIALTLTAGALSARAQGPIPPPPGAPFPGREFGPPLPRPGFVPDGPLAPHFRYRHHAPVVIPPDARPLPPPPMPPCLPAVRSGPPLAGFLRFVFER